MNQAFTLAAQLHSFPPLVDNLGVKKVIDKARSLVDAAGVEILIPGGIEIPELYEALTIPTSRPAPQVYLWLPVLADAPGCTSSHQVIKFDGLPGQGWGSPEMQAESGETFRFACPNHPAVRAAALENLEYHLKQYPFEGVFLDKIRFPSPANGIGDVLTCFCPNCRAAASATGLDLEEVRRFLQNPRGTASPLAGQDGLRGNDWLAKLLAENELLQQFVRFRCRSISSLVASLSTLARSLGRKVALDLFSPGLGMLVGQDYQLLAPMADWIKPMSYRYAAGPAGLRLEIPSLFAGLAEYLALPLANVETWAVEQVPGLSWADGKGVCERITAEGASLELISAETHRAVEWARPTPVLMGVEAVSIQEFQIAVTPQHIHQAIRIAQLAGASGAVLAWDILNMPLENMLAARTASLTAF